MPDHAFGLIDWARLVLATGVLFLGPGLAWHLFFWPRGADLGRLERLAGVVFASYVSSGVVAVVLARFGLLSEVPLVAAMAVLLVAGLSLSARRLAGDGPAASGLQRLPGELWRALVGSPSRRDVVGVLIGTAAILIIVVGPQILIVFGGDPATRGLPVGTITWYYWGLAEQMAETASIPARSAEWGGSYPFQGDYVLFSAFSAALGELGGRVSDMAPMEALRIAGLLWGVVAALGALRRFLPRPAVLLGTLLFFTAVHVFLKYTGYRPESFHYALVFSALWFTDRYAERPSLRRAVPVVATVVALWIGHGVVLVLAGLIAGGVVVGRWVVDRLPTRREFFALVAVGIAGLVASALTDFLLQGNVLLFSNAVDPGRIQAAFTSDLTWQFRQWALGGRHLLSGDPSEVERLITSRVYAPWGSFSAEAFPFTSYIDTRRFEWQYGLLLLPLVAWPWLTRAARRLYVASFVYLVGLLLAVASFLILYDTYVPQRVGFGRLAPFTLIASVLWVTLITTSGAALLAAFLGWLRRQRRVPPRLAGALEWRRAVAWGAAAVVLAAVAILPSVLTIRTVQEESKISPEGHAALVWVRDNTPADALVVANSYTEGSIATVAHRLGLTDGRAPYNKEFLFLELSVDLMREVRAFYAGQVSLREFVDARHVDVVIAAPDEFDLANAHPFCAPAAELAAPVVEAPAGSEPEPGGVPAAECLRDDLGSEPGLVEAARFGRVVVYLVDPSRIAAAPSDGLAP